MDKPIGLFTVTFLFLLFNQSLAIPGTYNILDLGTKPDGKTDSSNSLLSAWAAACGSPKPATIFVPKGKYFVKQAQFLGACKNRAISFRIDGTLVAPPDYNVIGNADFLLQFRRVDGVSIRGGILDGQGTGLSPARIVLAAQRYVKLTEFPVTIFVASLALLLVKNFFGLWDLPIHGLTSLNSQLFHLVFNGCNTVKLQGMKVSAARNSANTDGIHVQYSSGFTILNSMISTGDDCVSIGPGTSSLWIENVLCGPGHGISIGSLGKDFEEEEVQNVTVKSVTLRNTQNGARIKSWGRPSKGFVKDVLFQHITMINVQNPILVNQNYCLDNINCLGQVSGIKINDVTYQDIHGTSATEIAVKFDCSKKNPCSGIRLEDVKLAYKNQPAKSSCANAAGTTLGLLGANSCL